MYKLQHPNHDEIIGMSFGRLVVLEYVGKHKVKIKRQHLYKCQCDCGETVNVPRGLLLNGDTNSCGCLHRENGKKTGKQNRFTKGEAALNSLYGAYKRESKRRKKSFNLSKDEFKHITKQKCYYCDAEPSSYHQHSKMYGGYLYNGIDRKDNNLGYEKPNCVPCCMRCNQMKNNMTMEEFINQIININKKLRIIGE